MKKINQKDMLAWTEKTKRLNESVVLSIGDEVIDVRGNKGIVVRIIAGTDIEDHGCVFVWQSEQYDYGSDNCEHYVEINWYEHLRILNKNS